MFFQIYSLSSCCILLTLRMHHFKRYSLHTILIISNFNFFILQYWKTRFSYIHHVILTMSLKAFSMAPITKLSCETFFSVKKRVGGVLGEPGAPAAPRSEAARVRARLDVVVRRWLTGSSSRQVGGGRLGVQRISITSWRCRATWWWRRREATTAAPEPAWPSNNAQ